MALKLKSYRATFFALGGNSFYYRHRQREKEIESTVIPGLCNQELRKRSISCQCLRLRFLLQCCEHGEERGTPGQSHLGSERGVSATRNLRLVTPDGPLAMEGGNAALHANCCREPATVHGGAGTPAPD